jgi:hypothetical protein
MPLCYPAINCEILIACTLAGSFFQETLMHHGHTFLDVNGEGITWWSFKHCQNGACPPLGTLKGPLHLYYA